MSTFSIVDHLRMEYGVESLRAVLERPPGPADRAKFIAAYDQLVASVSGPPAKPSNELRPVFTYDGLSSVDEASMAARVTLSCHSVAVIVPDPRKHWTRVMRMAVLLEPLIDMELVVLLPDDFPFFEGPPDSSYYIQVLDALRNNEVPPVAAINASIALDACASFPNELDFACTSLA